MLGTIGISTQPMAKHWVGLGFFNDVCEKRKKSQKWQITLVQEFSISVGTYLLGFPTLVNMPVDIVPPLL